MKKAISLAMVLVASSFIFNGLAYADGKGKNLELKADMMVNGTEVKKGKYQVTFSEEMGEMSIWKGDKLIAKASARKAVRKNKAISTELLTSKQNQNSVLRGITLAGEQESIIINTNSETANAAPQQ